MNVREARFRKVEDFCSYVSKCHHKEWWCWYYRGHSNPDYKLLPKVGRSPFGRQTRDERMFNQWRRFAVAFVPPPASPLSDGDWLAIAQHHGLATRLLDWTFNPLTAAFFAVVDRHGQVNTGHDGVVYAHFSKRRPESISQNTPFSMKGISRLSPSSVTTRIARQGGIFTIHGPPSLALETRLPPKDRLERLVIDKRYKRDFAITLSHLGINRQALFPDLDGLSLHMNWVFSSLFHE